MLNRVHLLLSNMAIRVQFFAPLLPKYCLAKTTHSKTGETNLVTHQALCLRSARMLLLKVE